GYQASGAAIVRPSASSIASVSSLTSTRVARATRGSTVEEPIPTLQQLLLMLLNQAPDPVNLPPAEAVAALQANGIKPEFRLGIVAIDVDVWWFAAIACVEEKTVRPGSRTVGMSPCYPGRVRRAIRYLRQCEAETRGAGNRSWSAVTVSGRSRS